MAMGVSQGGHDIPDDKLKARFLRPIVNLQEAIRGSPEVRVYDNSELRTPYAWSQLSTRELWFNGIRPSRSGSLAWRLSLRGERDR